MRLIAICVLSVVGFVTALPVENIGIADIETDAATRNSVIEQVILDLIEELRQVMINGNDDIPVLDPLEVEHIYLQLDDIGLENSHLEASDIVVRDVSTFEIDDFSFRPSFTILQPFRHTMVLDAHIPALDITAKNYDLSVFIIGFTVFGNGEVKIRIVEPRLQVTLMANLRLIGGISLRILSANAKIGLVAFESGLTGVFNDDYLNDFVNAFLGEFIPELVDFYEAEISEALSALIVDVGNDILDNMNIGDLLPEITKLAGLPDSDNTVV